MVLKLILAAASAIALTTSGRRITRSPSSSACASSLGRSRTSTTVTNDILTVLLPFFSTLRQAPINLIRLEQRMEARAPFNKRLEKHGRRKLADFILSIVNLPAKPTQKPLSKKKLGKSLRFILVKLSQSFAPSRDQYVSWSRAKPRFPPIRWNLAEFPTAFFREKQ
jgi:hypothetical protein